MKGIELRSARLQGKRPPHCPIAPAPSPKFLCLCMFVCLCGDMCVCKGALFYRVGAPSSLGKPFLQPTLKSLPPRCHGPFQIQRRGKGVSFILVSGCRVTKCIRLRRERPTVQAGWRGQAAERLIFTKRPQALTPQTHTLSPYTVMSLPQLMLQCSQGLCPLITN